MLIWRGCLGNIGRESYPAPWIVQAARQLKIPLVYGSDAHAVEDVGRAYDYYLQLIKA